jgi:hypothetical protein
MPIKDFERTVQFYSFVDSGKTISFPLVTVSLVQAGGSRVSLPLLFDTGASMTSLRWDLFPLLGVSSWDAGVLQASQTAGGDALVDGYRYDGVTVEVFGKVINCSVSLIRMPANLLFVGLLGRDTIFQEFGFGFWESTKELLVSTSP